MKTLKGQRIFIIDAIGALVSIIFLACLYKFEEVFGMSKSVLVTFMLIAITFFIHSGIIFITNLSNWKFYLAIIALLNISYCLFILFHIFRNLDKIKPMGHIYFFVEILVILSLSIYELKLSRKTLNS